MFFNLLVYFVETSLKKRPKNRIKRHTIKNRYNKQNYVLLIKSNYFLIPLL